MDARKWLRANGYEEIADLIDEIMAEWRLAGKKTRRNWWDVLAGGKDGKPSIRAGKIIPVLRAAQIRQGRKVTPNSYCLNEDEEIPQVRLNNRWQNIKREK